MVLVWFLGQIPVIYFCIRSSRDGLGFYAEIQISFGTVFQQDGKGAKYLLIVSKCDQKD